MTRLLGFLCLGILATAVLAARVPLSFSSDSSLAHCGKCGEGDEEGEDHEHEGDDDESSLAHCGKCGEGDEEGEDHEHEGDDDESSLV